MTAQPTRFERRASRALVARARLAGPRAEDRVDRPVANIVDPIEVGAKLLDLGSQPGQIVERLVETGKQRLKCHQGADAQSCPRSLPGRPVRGP